MAPNSKKAIQYLDHDCTLCQSGAPSWFREHLVYSADLSNRSTSQTLRSERIRHLQSSCMAVSKEKQGACSVESTTQILIGVPCMGLTMSSTNSFWFPIW